MHHQAQTGHSFKQLLQKTVLHLTETSTLLKVNKLPFTLENRWLTPVIPATQEAEIRRTEVQG
jgi:hypothetical protein